MRKPVHNSRRSKSHISRRKHMQTLAIPTGEGGLRRVAKRIRRMTRRPMKEEEYAWIGAVLAECRARGRDRYLQLVGIAALDSGRIAACDQVYRRLRNGKDESRGNPEERSGQAASARCVSGRSRSPSGNRTSTKEG